MKNNIHGFATTYAQLKARVAAIQSAKGNAQNRTDSLLNDPMLQRESHVLPPRSDISKTDFGGPTVEVGLEQALRVPEGTLLNRLPGRRYSRYARTVKEKGSQQTAWGKKRTEERETLGPYAMPLAGTVHDQLLDCIDFKSDGFREGANKVNTWRIKPASETGCRLLEAE